MIPAAWKIGSQPVELPCGSSPLNLPAPAPAASPPGDRPLAHAKGIKDCQDQASVAAVCECLAKSIKTWGEGYGLSAEVECKPEGAAHGDAQVVQVSSKPAGESTAGGEAYVFVGKHGATWSPVEVIENAPDVDLSTTPQASHTSSIDRVEAKVIASGTLYWLESHNDATDKDTGDTDHEGEAHGTVCVVPTGAVPYCTKPLTLGAWTYAFTNAKDGEADACTTTKVSMYTATVDAKSVTVKLAHGSDTAGVAGRYVF